VNVNVYGHVYVYVPGQAHGSRRRGGGAGGFTWRDEGHGREVVLTGRVARSQTA
jgi:hypothetical protein